MSRTIDEKIVEMRFDNQDFERNVNQSMSTLAKLKSALDFSGVDKTFTGLSDAANKLNLGSISDALEDVGSKFSWLETIATGALLNIGASISSNLVNTLKSVTVDQVAEGFDKYESKTKAVQTIMAATGQEIDEVSSQLERLNWYTDETSYSFEDMVNNISKFTSNGIELEKAVTAMEGISNWAAVSGQGKNEAGRAMYNLSQALSAGAVMVKDWMSIENANMATKEFKEMAIQAAVARGELAKFYDDDTGEEFYATYSLDEFGNKLADVEVDYKIFRETLKEKWFSDEVLVDVLSTYGEFTDKLSEAYEDINSLDGVYVSTTQLIEFAEAYVDNTLDMEEAIAATGKTAEELSVIFAELGKEEYALGRKSFLAAREARTFTDAIEATKDAVSTQFMNAFEIIFGNYEEAKELWTDLADELAEIFAGPLSNINKMLSAWRTQRIGGRDDLIQGIKNIYYALKSIAGPISEAWESIFPSLTYERLAEIVAGFKNFTESLILSEGQMSAVGSAFENVFKIIKTAGNFLGGTVKELFDAFTSKAFEGSEGLFRGISIAIEEVSTAFENLSHTVSQIKSAVDDFKEGGDWLGIVAGYREQYPVLTWLVETFDKLKDSLSVLGEYAAKLFSLNDIFLYYGEAGGGIAGVLNILAFAFRDFITTAGDLIEIWTGFDLSKQIEAVWNFVHQFELAVEDIQADGWFTKIKDDIVGIGTAFHDTFGGFMDFFEPVFNALKVVAEDWVTSFSMLIGEGTEDLEGFFKAMDDGLISIQNFVKTNETLKAIMDGIKDAIKIVSEFAAKFLSIRQVIETYREAGGGLAGIFAVINEKIQIVFDLIGSLVKRFTGLDLSGFGNGILVVIQVIEEAFIRLADKIAQLFGWEDNPFHTLLETTESSFGKLQELFNGFSGINTGGLSGLGEKLKEAFGPIGSLFEGIGKVLYGAWTVVQSVIPLIGQALSWLGDTLVFLGERIKGMSFEEILDVVKIILTLVKIKKIMDLMGGFGDVLDGVTDTLKAWQTKLKAESLTALGQAILMIAGALLVVSLIPTDKLITSLEALGIALAALTVSLLLISNSFEKTFVASAKVNIKAVTSFATVLMAFGKACTDFAISAGIIVIAIKSLAGTEGAWEAIGQLGAVLGGITVALAALSALSKWTGSSAFTDVSKSILAISAALGVLVLVLKGFEGLNDAVGAIKEMALAFGAIAAITAGMTALIALINKIHEIDLKDIGLGMVELAAAMGVFVLVLKGLGEVSWGTLLGSLAKLAVSFLALGVIAAVVNKFGVAIDHFAEILEKLGKAILYLGIGIAILGVVGTIIGDSADEIAEAAVDLLVTVMDAIVARTDEIVEDLLLFVIGVLNGLAQHTPEIVALVIEIIAGIMQGVRDAFASGDFSAVDFAAGAGILGGLIGLVILLTKVKLTVADFAKAALVLIGAGILLTEIGALFIGIGALSNLIGGPEQLAHFGEFMDALVSAFMGSDGKGGVLLFFGVISGLLALTAIVLDKLGLVKGGNEGVGKVMGSVGEAFLVLEEFIAGVAIIIETMGLIFAGFGALDEQWHIAENIGKFGTMIEGLIEFFKKFAGFIAIIGTILLATAAVMSVLPAGTVAASIAEAGVITVEVIGIIGGIIEATGLLFAAFGGITAGIDALIGLIPGASKTAIEDAIYRFGDVCEAIFSVLGRIVGGLVGGVVEGVEKGKIKGQLEGLADGLVYFSQTAQPFFDMMGQIGEGTASAAESFVNMILKLTAAELLDAITIFKDDKYYEKLGDNIESLGTSIAGFVEKTKDLNIDDVQKAEACAQIIMALADGVPPTGGVLQWWFGEQDAGEFGDRLEKFGAGLMAFQNSTADLDKDTVDKAANAASVIIELSKEIPNQYSLVQWLFGTNDVGTFGDRLVRLGEGLAGFQEKTEGIDNDLIDKAAIAVKTMIELNTEIPDQGSWLRDLFVSNTGMDTFGKNLETFGQSFKNYADTIEGIDPDTISKTSEAIQGLVNIASVIAVFNQEGGFNGATLDLGTFEDFGKKLKGFGENVLKYYNKVKDIKTSTFESITKSIKELIETTAKADLKNSFFDLFESFSKGMSEAFDDQNGILNKFKGYLVTISNIPADEFYNLKLNSAGANVAMAIVKGFSDTVDLVAKTQAVLDEMVALITDPANVELFNKAGRQLLAAFGDGFTNSSFTASWQRAFNEYLDSIANLITDPVRLQQVRNAGSMFAQAVIEGLLSVDLEPAISQITTTITNGISGIDVSGAVSKINTDITNGISNIDVSGAVDKFGAELNNKIKEIDTSASTQYVGNNLSAGVAQGATDSKAVEKVKQAVEEVCDTGLETAKTKWEIKSPSEVWAILGKFADEGLAMGLIDNIPVVKEGILKLLDASMGGMSDANVLAMAQGMGFDLSSVFGDGIQDYLSTGMLSSLGIESADQYTSGMTDFLGEYDLGSILGEYGHDSIESYTDGMSDSLYDSMPGVTMTVEDFSENIDDAFSSSFNYDSAYDTTYTSCGGITDALIDYGEEAKTVTSNVMEESVLDPVRQVEEMLSSEVIEGPTIRPVLDFGSVQMQMDELEGYVLAFEMASKEQQEAMIRQAEEEYGSQELAERLRQQQAIDHERVNQALVDNYWQNYAASIAEEEQMSESAATMREMSDKLDMLNDNMTAMSDNLANANVYLDSGELVGAMAPRLDQEFGNLQKLGGRGI